jgi:hypothetical protein
MPDMDHFSGWARLLATSPSLVMSTAARDLGAPKASIPCSVATDSLTEGSGIAALELADGTEVWCTASDDAQGRSLCRRIAEEQLGLEEAEGLESDTLRRLSF